MARLYRPPIPLEVKLRVILRQLGEMFPDDYVSEAKKHRTIGRRLRLRLEQFAATLGCEVKDLRLDHDPALALRQKLQYSSAVKPTYIPGANDPEYLFYRPHGAQFAGSHDVKTRIRGDHGQFSDVVLIKRERRRQRRELKPEKKTSRLSSKKPKSAVRKKYRWAKRTFSKKKVR
jgi:hypothetical protein